MIIVTLKKDDIINFITKGLNEKKYGYNEIEIMTEIEYMENEDVKPIIHAYWYISEYEYFTCSHCHKSYYNSCESSKEAKEKLTNGDYYKYCPHCGAIMDEEV